MKKYYCPLFYWPNLEAKFTQLLTIVHFFQLTPDKEGAEILVPLTSCMYVPGNIADVNKMLLNIGTGYYVEKVSLVVK